jgi:hypothetical protein
VLRLNCSLDRIDRFFKDGVNAIACPFDEVTVVQFDRLAQNGIMLRERQAHLLRM